jgi:hypothetical protein
MTAEHRGHDRIERSRSSPESSEGRSGVAEYVAQRESTVTDPGGRAALLVRLAAFVRRAGLGRLPAQARRRLAGRHRTAGRHRVERGQR